MRSGGFCQSKAVQSLSLSRRQQSDGNMKPVWLCPFLRYHGFYRGMCPGLDRWPAPYFWCRPHRVHRITFSEPWSLRWTCCKHVRMILTCDPHSMISIIYIACIYDINVEKPIVAAVVSLQHSVWGTATIAALWVHAFIDETWAFALDFHAHPVDHCSCVGPKAFFCLFSRTVSLPMLSSSFPSPLFCFVPISDLCSSQRRQAWPGVLWRQRWVQGASESLNKAAEFQGCQGLRRLRRLSCL